MKEPPNRKSRIVATSCDRTNRGTKNSSQRTNGEQQLVDLICTFFRNAFEARASTGAGSCTQDRSSTHLLASQLAQDINAHFTIMWRPDANELKKGWKRLDRLSRAVKLSAEHCGLYYATLLKITELVTPSKKDQCDAMLKALEARHSAFEEHVRRLMLEDR